VITDVIKTILINPYHNCLVQSRAYELYITSTLTTRVGTGKKVLKQVGVVDNIKPQ